MNNNQDGPGVAIISYIVIGILVISLGIGAYFIKRWWNTFWYYDNAIEIKICEMVNPEYIKEEYCK